MGIQKAYDDWSTSYDHDRNLTRDLDQNVLQETLAGLRFKSILELGCGTGKNTAILSQIGEYVHALDFSEGMISQARNKVRAGNVQFSLTNLTVKWPCQNAYYDLVVCDLVLEHIPDLGFIFSEVSRVLQQKGKFLVNELHPFRQYEGKKATFSRDEQVTEIDAFVHHISDFLNAAAENDLSLVKLEEWWHTADQDKPPRLVSFLFEK